MTTDASWVATSALATVALLCVTAAYAWITYRMLQATREQSWQASRPRLLIAARTNQGGQFLLLHIENVGVGVAHELRLDLDRPVHRMVGEREDFRELPFFKNGLRALSPNTPSRFGIAGSFDYLAENADRSKHPLSFEITATYMHERRRIVERFPIDIEDQYGSSSVERDYVDEFGKAFPAQFEHGVRQIVSAIESVRGG